MNQYILFFDIDGTLLHVPSGQKKPSEKLKTAFKELHKKGHLCFIATGRTYAYLNKDILDLEFDGFVTCNGAVVLKDDQVIISHYFPKDKAQAIIKFLEENENGYTICDARKAHASEKYKEIFKVFKEFNVPSENISTDTNLDHLNVAKFEITAKNEYVANYINNLTNDQYEIVNHGMNIYEINMPNVSKGKAILELLQILDIPVENSIAFGDGNNDIEMLRTVGRGVCMGNGSDEAKAAADVVTESCADDGIVKELQRLGIIGG